MDQDYKAQQHPWWFVLTPCVAVVPALGGSEDETAQGTGSSSCLDDGTGENNLLLKAGSKGA